MSNNNGGVWIAFSERQPDWDKVKEDDNLIVRDFEGAMSSYFEMRHCWVNSEGISPTLPALIMATQSHWLSECEVFTKEQVLIQVRDAFDAAWEAAKRPGDNNTETK